MYGYIYKITVDNPKSCFHGCYYIGQSRYDIIRKPCQYWGSSVYLAKYKKKYHTDGLIKEILCECINEDDLNQKEIEYIGDLYLTDAYENGGKCLNLQSGGQNNFKFSEKTYNKISKLNREHGWKKNHTPWNKGLKYTEEQKVNLVKANKSKPTYGHLGKVHSDETKQKISEIQKDWVWWTNGVEEKHCKDCPGVDWYRGRVYKTSEELCKKFSTEFKKRKWWNNGIIDKFVEKCPGDDFVLGRLNFRKKDTLKC